MKCTSYLVLFALLSLSASSVVHRTITIVKTLICSSNYFRHHFTSTTIDLLQSIVCKQHSSIVASIILLRYLPSPFDCEWLLYFATLIAVFLPSLSQETSNCLAVLVTAVPLLFHLGGLLLGIVEAGGYRSSFNRTWSPERDSLRS